MDGRSVRLGGTHQRAVLALLVLGAGDLVPAVRLVDEIWGEQPPASALNIVQGHVSALRKELGRDRSRRASPATVLRAAHDAGRPAPLRAAGRGRERGARARPARARGRAAAGRAPRSGAGRRSPTSRTDGVASAGRGAAGRAAAARARAAPRRGARAAAGTPALVAELEALVAEHPLRERPRALLMLALYRCRRGRRMRSRRTARRARRSSTSWASSRAARCRSSSARSCGRTLPRARPAAAAGGRAARSWSAPGSRPARSGRSWPSPSRWREGRGARSSSRRRRRRRRRLGAAVARDRRAVGEPLAARGVPRAPPPSRAVTPGADLARLALEQDVDLVLVDAPGRPARRRATSLSSCSSTRRATWRSWSEALPRGGAGLVPFTGAEHDWSAVELGAWLGRSWRRAPPPRRARAAPAG